MDSEGDAIDKGPRSVTFAEPHPGEKRAKPLRKTGGGPGERRPFYGLRRGSVQLAWPFALVGATIGLGLPPRGPSAVTIALVLALFGAVVSAAMKRARDWQVALLSPVVGALTGAAIGWSLDGLEAAAVGVTAGIGFGLMSLPPLVLMTDAARRAAEIEHHSVSARAVRRRVWLLSLAMAAMAALTVPVLAAPATAPVAHSALADWAIVGMVLLSLLDVAALARLMLARPPAPAMPHPYREAPDARDGVFAAKTAQTRLVLAECLTVDSLLLLAVVCALVLAR
jgi:hypothetical protein